MRTSTKSLLLAAVAGFGLAFAPTGAQAASSPYQFSMPENNNIPTALRPGQKVDGYQKIINRSTSSVPGVNWIFTIDEAGLTKNQPPTVWWRVDHGPWRLMVLHYRPTGYGDPAWRTTLLPLGSFAAHQTHTLELSWSFTTRSHKGIYAGWGEVYAKSGAELGTFDAAGSYYPTSRGY